MKIIKFITYSITLILLIVCFISFIIFININNKLDIHKTILMEGIFDISNKEYQFDFNELKNRRYNIIIKFKRFNDDKIDNYLSEYSISSKISKLNDKNLLLQNIIDDKNRGAEISSLKEYKRYIISFTPEKNVQYHLNLIFNGYVPVLDSIEKEIYLEEDYDYAAIPFLEIGRIIFLFIFTISLLGLVLSLSIRYLNKNNLP